MAKKSTANDATSVANTNDAATDPAIASLSYEEAIGQLERLVESIERGDVGLAESLASYKKGEQLLRHCKGLLDKAELSVREMSLADAEGAAG